MAWRKRKIVLLLQAYLKLLLPVIGSNAKPAQSSTEARVAARCMCGLLTALHHFNYAADLLQAVVPLMVSKDAQLRQLSFDAIREVLMNDEEGKVAVEAVQLVRLLLCRHATHTCHAAHTSCFHAFMTNQHDEAHHKGTAVRNLFLYPAALAPCH